MINNLIKYNCIGILGGTFNPVHKGHTMLAEEVIEQFPDIEKLLLMPNNLPAYKDTDHIIDSQHRLNMLRLVSAQIPKSCVSDMEIARGGTTYTIDTLKQIKSIKKDIKIYFIIGADSLFNIEQWRNFEDIFNNCTLIAAKRDCNFDDIISYSHKLQIKYPALKICFLNTHSIDISSSKLRENIKAGKLDTEFMDESIISYIKENKLYGWT